MSAFFIATSTIIDSKKISEYAQAAAKTFPTYGGQPVLKGKFDETLTNNEGIPHQAVGVIQFPSLESLKNWYQSADYQALIPLRDEAAHMTISSYSVPG